MEELHQKFERFISSTLNWPIERTGSQYHDRGTDGAWKVFNFVRPTPDLTKSIVWTGECDNANHGQRNYNDLCCPKCKGTGEYKRPATLEEVVEVAKELIKPYIIHADSYYMLELETKMNTELNKRLTINGGTLSIKEGDEKQ